MSAIESMQFDECDSISAIQPVRFDQSAIRLAMKLSNNDCGWYALRVVCTMHLILCTSYYTLRVVCTMYLILCTSYYILRVVHYVPVLPGAVGTVPPAIPSTSVLYQSLECTMPVYVLPLRSAERSDVKAGPLTKPTTRTPPSLHSKHR
jgi:hypothetical protein